MSNELEDLWKEVASVQAEHKCEIFLRRLKKTVKNLGQYSRYQVKIRNVLLPIRSVPIV